MKREPRKLEIQFEKYRNKLLYVLKIYGNYNDSRKPGKL